MWYGTGSEWDSEYRKIVSEPASEVRLRTMAKRCRYFNKDKEETYQCPCGKYDECALKYEEKRNAVRKIRENK